MISLFQNEVKHYDLPFSKNNCCFFVCLTLVIVEQRSIVFTLTSIRSAISYSNLEVKATSPSRSEVEANMLRHITSINGLQCCLQYFHRLQRMII